MLFGEGTPRHENIVKWNTFTLGPRYCECENVIRKMGIHFRNTVTDDIAIIANRLETRATENKPKAKKSLAISSITS